MLNPRLPLEFRLQATRVLLPLLPGHLWFLTSGSTGEQKGVALSKEALLASAAAVNRHLDAAATDVWLNPLPLFHVGGIGIEARAYLTASMVIPLAKWAPEPFTALCKEQAVTLSALVPTQVYDLVSRGLTVPPSLRALIVGGGVLSETLYQKGRALGWPLLPSYGLSECASQVATAKGEDSRLHLLDHIEAQLSARGTLMIKSPALLTAYAHIDREAIWDPKIAGWLETEDCAELNGQTVRIKGRLGDFVKVSGETVALSSLTALFEEEKSAVQEEKAICLVALDDPRLGSLLALAVEGEITEGIQKAVQRYNAKVLPFERIQRVESLAVFPRSELGKLLVPKIKVAIPKLSGSTCVS